VALTSSVLYQSSIPSAKDFLRPIFKPDLQLARENNDELPLGRWMPVL
jgi:hypothetical protein